LLFFANWFTVPCKRGISYYLFSQIASRKNIASLYLNTGLSALGKHWFNHTTIRKKTSSRRIY